MSQFSPVKGNFVSKFQLLVLSRSAYSHARGYLWLGNLTSTLKLFDPHRSLVMLRFAQSVASSVGPATISPFKTKTLKNTPLTNQASTLANPAIIPTFVEVNYEVLKSLLTERRKKMSNEDLCTKLDYYSEEYDEEREMEPRPTPKESGSYGVNLPPLLAAHLGRNESGQPPQTTLTSVYGGHQPSTNSKGNLLPNCTHLSYNAPPFIPNSLQPSNGHIPTNVNPYSQPNVGMTYGQPLSHPFHAQGGFIGCATLFVRWIKDYPLPDGLKMPSHVGSYDGKGDPDNYLHLFEGAIHMQKWAILVACHMFTYTLKDSTRIKAKEVATNGALTDHREGFNRVGEWKKKDKDIIIEEAPILMISRESPSSKRKSMEEPVEGIVTFPPVSSPNNSSDPFIIKVYISERQVNRAYMDSDSLCEVIYEDCFLKLKPSIRALIVDLKIPLVGFSVEHSWPLERNVMQKMGIVVSTIHVVIKFHTPYGISTVPSTYESNKVEEGQKQIKEVNPEVTRDVLICIDSEERIVVNDEHPEQTVFIKKQQSASFKKKLQDLLRSNSDVFAWTYVDMIGIPRTIMVGWKPFNTEHKLNEYMHIKLVKQKKRGRSLDRNEIACKEVDELMKARILRKVKDHWVSTPFKSLNGKLATLSRFLSKGVEKSLPFFKELKCCTDKKTIWWKSDAEEAFQKIKKFMEILPTLTAPIKGEVLLMIGEAHVSLRPCYKKTPKVFPSTPHPSINRQTGNGYQQKDKNKAKPDKNEHGNGKSAQNRSRRNIHF
ncbi:hypothetical protein Tco_0731699 [Tanacetum coccineum]